jgi:hypothetical protein
MKAPVFEVVVYTVQEEKLHDFLQQQPIAHNVIKQFKGFKSLHTLRSLESPNTFVDYCEWESHDDAVKANEMAMNAPELKMFFELGDGVITFGHYTSGLLTEV